MTSFARSAPRARMWTYYPELLATPVPRYTSFPTAAEFGDKVGEQEFRTALQRASGDISAYVHIPFCDKICWYCGCNTTAANRTDRLRAYLDSLHREIAMVGALMPADARLKRISIGGGSPNAIAPLDFVRLLDTMFVSFGPRSPVISIELDPRALAPEWGHILASVGVTRASLGVQTFTPALQQAIGRVQPIQMIEDATIMLRRSGVTSLNFDLMYGLPGQTLNDVENSLRHALRLGADRIAFFGYAHVPHMISRQKQIDASDLPGAGERFGMAQLGYDLLCREGFVPVGFDHFARPQDSLAQAVREGTVHRNFQGFTDDTAPVLIGLGSSSISSFPDLLIQNNKNSGSYRELISQDRLASAHGIARTQDDQDRGKIISDLLCRGRADVSVDIRNDAMERLEPYLAVGLCDWEGDRLRILKDSVPYARSIAAAFDPYRKHSPTRFSSAV